MARPDRQGPVWGVSKMLGGLQRRRESSMSLMRYVLMAALMLGATAVRAQEGPPLLNGSYEIKVYQADCGGSTSCATANPASPVLSGTPLATLNYSGVLDFTDGGVNDILHFLQSGGGTITGDTGGLTGKVLSSGGFGTTTFLDITFTTGRIPDGSIEHDDGVSLYVGETLLTPAGQRRARPPQQDTTFPGTGGDYRLIYSAANGLPEVLILSGTVQPDYSDFGCRIDLAQTNVAQQFKFTLPATLSDKFCPQYNNGILKLHCSGPVPGYPSGSPTSLTGVKCQISGSQCGLSGFFEASTPSISISSEGVADLTCEASVSQ